jgi:hypothetical protein
MIRKQEAEELWLVNENQAEVRKTFIFKSYSFPTVFIKKSYD